MRFQTRVKTALATWYLWAFLMAAGVLWGFQPLPFYEEGLPYVHELAGFALLALYLSLGCLNVGLGIGVLTRLRSGDSRPHGLFGRSLKWWLGGSALMWIAIYWMLAGMSTNLG